MRIGIFFGGRSREREISFAGGRTVFDNLDKSLFEPVPIFVDSFGNFILIETPYLYKGSVRDFYPPIEHIPKSDFQIYAESLGDLSIEEQEQLFTSLGKSINVHEFKDHFDFAFLALHGAYGEDGSLQGILQWSGIPYSASGILASAMGMDKVFQKRLMAGGDFPLPAYHAIKREQWLTLDQDQRTVLYRKLINGLGKPFVVKPANQGSSIGASIVGEGEFKSFEKSVNSAFFIDQIHTAEWRSFSEAEKEDRIKELVDLRSGVGLPVLLSGENISDELIYHPDVLFEKLEKRSAEHSSKLLFLAALDQETEVLCEAFISGKEFSCVVVRDEHGKAIALPPTEIRKGSEVFDYRSKYLAGLSSKVTPIELDVDAVSAIRSACAHLFEHGRFQVYARIDGFYGEDGQIYLNDPNTTSGMLPSSFFFHQAAEIGLSPKDFLTFIIHRSYAERISSTSLGHQYQADFKRLQAAMHTKQQQQAERIRVGVVMGGYSSERHISVESGRNIFEKLSASEKYAPIPIFLTGDDSAYQLHQIPINILLKDNADDIRDKIMHFKEHPALEVIRKDCISIKNKFSGSDQLAPPTTLSIDKLAEKVDVVFIALHGRPGEDGTLQKSLEAKGIPYNGSGIASSLTTINKYNTLQFLRSKGFHTADQVLIHQVDWEKDPAACITTLAEQLSFPFIAKPVDDGCSSAVKKIDDAEEFKAFAQLMFRQTEDLDPIASETLGLLPKEEFPIKSVILCEELIHAKDADHFLEVTGGLITSYDEQGQLQYELFEPSETLADDEILSLEEKFLAGQGQNITPARFSGNPEQAAKISAAVRADLAKAAQLLDVQGYARIDAFVWIKGEEIRTYIIEVNSLPGMTPATCIFHQCAINGYSPFGFIDGILSFGIERQKRTVAQHS